MNNSLTQTGKQLLAIWQQLGLNQRVSLVLTAGAVFVGLGCLVFWSSQADYTLLYGKLPPAEAGKVVDALKEAKIPYKMGGSGDSVMVPADKVYQVRAQLASKGIPRGDGVGFEIFDKPNFGISDFVQRANYLRAVQGELARTISEVDGVEAARVMVTLPENRLLVDQQKKPTASVFVRVRGTSPLPQQTVNAIRFLVANSVEGLQANNVIVADQLGNTLFENTENDTIAGLTTTQLAARKSLEQYLAKKAEDMLSTVLGPGQAVVRVSAEINFDSSTRTEEKLDPDSQVTRVATVNDENVETTSNTTAGGVPGVSNNASTDTNAVAGVTAGPNRTKKKVMNNTYDFSKTVSSSVQSAGGIRRLSAAVFIAARSEGTGAARKVTPRSTEELDKLRKLVQGALGIQNNDNDPLRKDQLTLEEMPFNDQPALEITRQIEKQHTTDFWMSLAGKALYPALAILTLGFFWRLFKRTPGEGIPLGVPLGDFSNTGNGTGFGGQHRPPVVTVEVLNQLIRENPTNMTQAIRSWMDRPKSSTN
jgi:flagellar M-ring protein FliF